MREYLLWLLSLEALGLAALPLTAYLFRSFPDRGYGLSKPLGLLFVAFMNWWLGSLAGLGNYPAVLWALVAVLALGGLALYRTGIARVPAGRAALLQTIAIEEALFLVAFLAWTYVRSRNPDIYSTEKPMDFMLLQVSGMAHSFPPPDAWLSGHTVNYYYLGYAIFGMLGRLSSVDPRYGFNLANITIFALAASGGYALALSLIRGRLWAFAGAFTIILAGDLDGLGQVLGQLQAGGLSGLVQGQGGGLTGINLFCSTRIIDGPCGNYHTISEFPIFSMLWNDLHPHVMALPFALLAIGVAFQAILDRPDAPDPAFGYYLRLVCWAIILGALFPINSWDYPTYLLLALAAMLVALYRRGGLGALTGWSVAAIVPASLLAYSPYYLTVHLNGQGIGVRANPTDLGDLFTVLGAFIVPALILAIWRFVAMLVARDALPDGRETPPLTWLGRLPAGGGWWLVGTVVALVLIVPAHTELLLLSLLLLAGATIVGRLRDEQPEMLMVLGLAFGGALLLLLSDYVYLRDIFDNGPNYRMNTVFKLYYQAWLFLALGAAYAVATVARALRRFHWGWRAAWLAAAGLTAVALAIYPIEGVASQGDTQATTPGLDGLAYVAVLNTNDYQGIQWIRGNVPDTAVIAEANGPDSSKHECAEYWVCGPNLAYNRISALTGRPTVIGWPGSHESLWRGAGAATELAQRQADIRTLYTTTDPQQALAIVRRYHIRYIYVGPLERVTYADGQSVSPQAMATFANFAQPRSLAADVTIYEVPESAFRAG